MAVAVGDTNDVALGENSRMTINAAVFSVIRGTIREDPNKIVTSDNGTGGFTRKSRGPRDCVVDVEAYWVASQNPIGNPPNLEPGSNTTGPVQVWPDFINAPNQVWTFPVAYVGPRSVVIDGVGVCQFSGSLENQGKYTSPSRPT